MSFLLGLISGLLSGLILSLVVMVAGLYVQIKYREQISKALGVVAKKTMPKGAIFLPLDDAREARELIIKKNDEEGRPTHISELEDK